MKTSKFTDEQIALARRHAKAGTPPGEICREREVLNRTTQPSPPSGPPNALSREVWFGYEPDL